ncbi:nucleotide-binding domain-containing protein [Aaosphaeria arxii CBS 175.79]|uniref:Nucleotide-binding domain-containing protein n=1 Tax=Aaosphaeria arxii CBS 175.79 TaxID=1450172 RepID=A0A6A5YAF4_9PLEO|nr:nucleotide-binding domain-containing protein [Aaosphaeria arxii CBS 175.79]KAF2021564.1 nucleotide-binding domain-containing protein [Aaosphaeria arxii CBS 175.79]
MSQPKENIVILGGGIIGLSIAYYLSQDPNSNRSIHIIDSAPTLLESASGYAGGFLTRDWFDPRLAPFGEFSFKLHRELAESSDGHRRWGYCGSHVYSLTLNGAPGAARGEDWLLEGTSRAQAVGRKTVGHVSAPGESVNSDGTPSWITPQEEATWEVVAGTEDCGQLDPRKLCEHLLSECQERGVEIVPSTRATANKQRHDQSSVLTLQSSVDDKAPSFIRCTNLIIAAGCWTPRVLDTLFPGHRVKLEIDALAGYSIVYKTPRYTKPFRNIAHGEKGKFNARDKYVSYAIYCPSTKHWTYSPEAFARLSENEKPEIWVGGLNRDQTQLPLPELATDCKKLMKSEDLANLRQTAVHMTGLPGLGGNPTEDDLEILREGLCFRPVSKSGVPTVGRIAPMDLGADFRSGLGAKVWIASGHGPWGISMALGTGVVINDLISEREPSVDISALQVQTRAPGGSKM